MKYSVLKLIIIFLMCYYTSLAQEDENTFIKITATLAMYPDLQQYLFDYRYNEKPSLIILNREEIPNTAEKLIITNSKEVVIYYWPFKNIFHNNVEYWLEVKVFEVDSNRAYLEYKTFNSANTLGKRKKIKGNAKLMMDGIEWRIIACQYVEW